MSNLIEKQCFSIVSMLHFKYIIKTQNKCWHKRKPFLEQISKVPNYQIYMNDPPRIEKANKAWFSLFQIT